MTGCYNPHWKGFNTHANTEGFSYSCKSVAVFILYDQLLKGMHTHPGFFLGIIFFWGETHSETDLQIA